MSCGRFRVSWGHGGKGREAECAEWQVLAKLYMHEQRGRPYVHVRVTLVGCQLGSPNKSRF